MSEEDDDPFACFGSDDDDEHDDQATENTTFSVAQQLKEKANKGVANKALRGNDKTAGSGSLPSEPPIDLSSIDSITLWPDDPPMYSGPIILAASLPVGGGRGFVASRKLPPGTLILVEAPIIAWPKEQVGKPLDLVSVRHILEHPAGQAIVRDMEDLHPTKSQVDIGTGDAVQVRSMMQAMKAQYEDDARVEELVALAMAKRISCRGGSSLTETDIIRLYLALRYNGLQSGLYRHVAMLNHDCHPNCVKLMPTMGYSEVRTTRHVAAGENLTISYLPQILSHATRRKTLWEQHRFDIGTDLGEWRFMELVRSGTPPSFNDRCNENTITSRIEKTISQLEDHYQDVANIINGGDQDSKLWDEIKALEVTSQELCVEARNQLQNDRHILLIPCMRLHLDICDLMQRDSGLTRSQRIQLLCRSVVTSRNLLGLQTMHAGRDHFDLAQSSLEYAEGVKELLSNAPKELLKLKLEDMRSFNECASAEHTARQEYERVKALYPDDAEKWIKNG